MSDAMHWPPPTVASDAPLLAHFGWRLLGFIADAARILLLFAVVIVAHAVLIASWASDQVSGLGVAVVAIAAIWAPITWEGAGGSPLRRMHRAWIVDATTLQPIGTTRGLVRALVRIASELVLYLGYLWMIWDPKRQTWHDKAARSIVVKR